MDIIDGFNFGAALASILLALVAIALTIAFFVLSSKLYNSTGKALIKIDESINKLEKLTDAFYGKFFDIHRETIGKMAEHAWGDVKPEREDVSEEVRKLVDEKVDGLITRYDSKITEVLDKQQITRVKVEAIRKEKRNVVTHAVRDTRKVEKESKEKVLKGLIFEQLSGLGPLGFVDAEWLVETLAARTAILKYRVAREVRKLIKEGTILSNTPSLSSNSKLRLPGETVEDSD